MALEDLFRDTPEVTLRKEFDAWVKKHLGPDYFVKCVMGRTPDKTEYMLERHYPDRIGCFGSWPKSTFKAGVWHMLGNKWL